MTLTSCFVIRASSFGLDSSFEFRHSSFTSAASKFAANRAASVSADCRSLSRRPARSEPGSFGALVQSIAILGHKDKRDQSGPIMSAERPGHGLEARVTVTSFELGQRRFETRCKPFCVGQR